MFIRKKRPAFSWQNNGTQSCENDAYEPTGNDNADKTMYIIKYGQMCIYTVLDKKIKTQIK